MLHYAQQSTEIFFDSQLPCEQVKNDINQMTKRHDSPSGRRRIDQHSAEKQRRENQHVLSFGEYTDEHNVEKCRMKVEHHLLLD